MILIVGPLFNGKREFACSLLGCPEKELSRYAVWDVQELVAGEEDLEKLAERLAKTHQVVIATEIGGGVVPIQKEEREFRERAGRLNCLLAQRADTVVRVFCGIPTVLRGKLP